MIRSVADFVRYFGGMHRSYLSEAGIEPPQVYGWRMEDVLARIAREDEPVPTQSRGRSPR